MCFPHLPQPPTPSLELWLHTYYSVITLILYGPQNQCYNEVPVYN